MNINFKNMNITVENIGSSNKISAKVDTKFMQDYRVASPVHAGKSVLALTNGEGKTEFFSIGTDNTIWNFYPDATSDTGYSGIPTGLKGEVLAGGCDAFGRLVVFTAEENKLHYVYAKQQEGARWSDKKIYNLPAGDKQTKICKITTKKAGEQLYVAICCVDKFGNYSLTAWSQFQVDSPIFTPIVSDFFVTWYNYIFEVTEPHSVFLSYFFRKKKLSYSLSSATFSQYEIKDDPGLNIIGSCCINGRERIYGIYFNSLYHIDEQNVYKVVENTKDLDNDQLRVVADKNGNISVFCLTKDKELLHWQEGFRNFIPICKNVMQVSAENGNNLLLATTENTLLYMYQEELSDNWVTQQIEIGNEAELQSSIEGYSSYSTDIALYDSDGISLPNKIVRISATEEAIIAVNGKMCFIDPQRTVDVKTNNSGVLSVVQKAEALAAPSIMINVPEIMPETEFLTIEQSAVVQAKLSKATADDIINAVITAEDIMFPTAEETKQPLVPNKYRTQDIARNIAKANQDLMSLIGPVPASEFRNLKICNQNKQGLWMCSNSSPSNLRQLRGKMHNANWFLSFEDGNVNYQKLTAAEAEMMINDAKGYDSANGFWGRIGEFFKAVKDGLCDLVNCVVKTIDDGIRACFTIVIDGIKYFFEETIKFIQEAFDFVEIIWHKIEVFFTDLFKWLGDLFNWNDILRTHQVVKHAFNQIPDFIDQSVDILHSRIDRGIDNFQQKIDELFAQGIAYFEHGTIRELSETYPSSPDTTKFNMSNNFLCNGLINNQAKATPQKQLTLTDIPPSVQELFVKAKEYSDNLENDKDFIDANTKLQDMGKSSVNLFNSLMSELLKLIQKAAKAALNGCKKLLDALFKIIREMIAYFKDFINTPWNIPFVTKFYKTITGSEMSMVDVMALIVAIPATAIYKSASKKAPFPDDASVQEFKSVFTAEYMLQALQMQPGSAKLKPMLQIPQNTQAALTIVSGVCYCYYGLFTAINDASSANPIPPPFGLAVAAFICESAAWVLGFPGNTWLLALWLVDFFGLSLDGFYLKFYGKMPENISDFGVVLAVAYGLIRIALAFIGIQVGEKKDVIVNSLISTPSILKFLLFKDVVTASKGISLIVCSGADALIYMGSGIYSVISAAKGIDSDEAEFLDYSFVTIEN